MLLAVQNKYWGTLEEATQFWSNLGINHLMIKPVGDFQLLNRDGEIIEENFKRLARLQEKYRVRYHLHPYNLVVNGVYLTPSLKRAQPILRRVLVDLDQKIFEYGLYPLITLHLGRFGHPEYAFDLDEKSALESSVGFFQNLNLKSRLALETMHDPYRNPGHAMLGYKAEHFLKSIPDKNLGLCIDTGHVKMAKEPLEKFLELPYPIYSVHLNGNDGTGDQHQLPTRENVGDFEQVVRALKKCEGPIVFEIRNDNYSSEELGRCIDFWKGLIEN